MPSSLKRPSKLRFCKKALRTSSIGTPRLAAMRMTARLYISFQCSMLSVVPKKRMSALGSLLRENQSK